MESTINVFPAYKFVSFCIVGIVFSTIIFFVKIGVPVFL